MGTSAQIDLCRALRPPSVSAGALMAPQPCCHCGTDMPLCVWHGSGSAPNRGYGPQTPIGALAVPARSCRVAWFDARSDTETAPGQ